MKRTSSINWDEYEEILYNGLEEAVYRFAEKYKSIEFYGLCIDCNAEYGDVLLHFNTEEDIEKNNKEDKWDVGDWEYFDVIDELEKDDGFFNNAWGKHKQNCVYKMYSVESSEGFDCCEAPVEEFMLMMSKIAIRLKLSPAVGYLRKTRDFKLVAVDHDEEMKDGFLRIMKLENA